MTAKKAWQDSDKLAIVIRELEKHGNVTQAMKTGNAARGWTYGKRSFAEPSTRSRVEFIASGLRPGGA